MAEFDVSRYYNVILGLSFHVMQDLFSAFEKGFMQKKPCPTFQQGTRELISLSVGGVSIYHGTSPKLCLAPLSAEQVSNGLRSPGL